MRRKKDSSLRVAINQVKVPDDGEAAAHACVSAGNTGALMAVARYVLKTVEGIDRPAIAALLPNAEGRASPRCSTSAPTSIARPSICCSSR